MVYQTYENAISANHKINCEQKSLSHTKWKQEKAGCAEFLSSERQKYTFHCNILIAKCYSFIQKPGYFEIIEVYLGKSATFF
jgi:hypothetical protein